MPAYRNYGAISVKIPLTRSEKHGYTMLEDLPSVLRQNLITLIRTIPGERVMAPDYGVGIKTFLFENFSESTFGNIDSKVREQVDIYMPMIRIINVSFDRSDEDRNSLIMSISYSIPSLGAIDRVLLPVAIGEQLNFV